MTTDAMLVDVFRIELTVGSSLSLDPLAQVIFDALEDGETDPVQSLRLTLDLPSAVAEQALSEFLMSGLLSLASGSLVLEPLEFDFGAGTAAELGNARTLTEVLAVSRYSSLFTRLAGFAHSRLELQDLDFVRSESRELPSRVLQQLGAAEPNEVLLNVEVEFVGSVDLARPFQRKDLVLSSRWAALAPVERKVAEGDLFRRLHSPLGSPTLRSYRAKSVQALEGTEPCLRSHDLLTVEVGEEGIVVQLPTVGGLNEEGCSFQIALDRSDGLIQVWGRGDDGIQLSWLVESGEWTRSILGFACSILGLESETSTRLHASPQWSVPSCAGPWTIRPFGIDEHIPKLSEHWQWLGAPAEGSPSVAVSLD